MTMQDGSIAITGAAALIGSNLRLVEDAVVVIDGDRIVAAGSAGEVGVPAGTDVIDAEGLTLMPGFIDAHIHIGFYPPEEVLAGGVTTARDLGWPPELIYPLVERSRLPDFEGPTLVAAGPMVTVAGGYPTRAAWAPPGIARIVSGPEDARTAVGEIASHGTCVIKVALNAAAGPTIDAPTLRAVVEAAAAHGLRVTAHVTGLDELVKATDAGVAELAHMLMSTERIPDELIARMVERKMATVPTLSCRKWRDRRLAIDNLRRFLIAGGTVVYGTDLGNNGPRPGIDRREVRAMAAAGMAPVDIIAAATITAARWLSLDDVGVIEPGRTADIVGVAGSVLDDVDALYDVRIVVRRGRRVRRARGSGPR